jgi:hypothetical protein
MKHFIRAPATNEPDNIGFNFSKEEGHRTISTQRFGSDIVHIAIADPEPMVIQRKSELV